MGAHTSAVGASLEQSFLIPQGAGLSHTPSVVFTADGKRMLTATSENEVAIFEVATKQLLKRVKFPEAGTNGVSIDASGRYVAWALKAGGVAVMELESERIIARDASLQTQWVAVSPDAKFIAMTHASIVEVRELATLAFARAVPAQGSEVTAVAWSADGSMIASTTKDGRVLVHRGERKVYEAKKPEALYAVAFHPAGVAVAYGGHDKQFYQWDFAAGREEVISKGQPYWITALGYSPDGTMLAVGDESCDIWLYRVKTKEMTFHNKHHNECWLSAVAWAPDNETFLFGCRPNGHAGKPTLHAPLARAEAARSQTVRAWRAKLLAAMDGLVAAHRSCERRVAEHSACGAAGAREGARDGRRGGGAETRRELLRQRVEGEEVAIVLKEGEVQPPSDRVQALEDRAREQAADQRAGRPWPTSGVRTIAETS